MFSIKVKMNSTKRIINEHGLDENGRVTKYLRNTVDRFCDPYVPMDTGIGKNTKTYPNNHSIKYTQPYMHAMYKGNVFISPKLGVSGVVIQAGANQRWWSPKGEIKKKTNRKYKYQGAPKRGAEWDKRMMNDRGKEVCKDVENYIKNGGK